MRGLALFVTGAGLLLPVTPLSAQSPSPIIGWKKTVLDTKFRAEGATFADVNRDGKTDILTGEVWYEAPNWKQHEIRPSKRDYGNGIAGYSESFSCWADDVNGDGWPDLIVIGFPGAPCYWYENPQGKEGHWKEHEIWHSACNETPIFTDLLGNGKRVLVMGWQPKGKENQGQMAWFTPGKDPNKLWEMHPISVPSAPGKEVPGTQKFSHGLGVSDLNGDGRADVICTGGWWEQPAVVEEGKPWKFHPAKLGEPCSDMFAYDVDGDGLKDVLSSSAHKFGIWWHKQRPNGDNPVFEKHDLFKDLFSETHALHFVDMNGDGLPDLVTGKRWWSHGRNEPGSDKPAVIYWFENQRGKDGMTKFIPHQVDADSGIGVQFSVGDVNGDGLPDIVTANKKGVFLFEQVRKKLATAAPAGSVPKP